MPWQKNVRTQPHKKSPRISEKPSSFHPATMPLFIHRIASYPRDLCAMGSRFRCASHERSPAFLISGVSLEDPSRPAANSGSAYGRSQFIQSLFQGPMYIRRRPLWKKTFEFLDEEREIPLPLSLIRRLPGQERKIVRGLVHGHKASVDRMPPWERRECGAVQQLAG